VSLFLCARVCGHVHTPRPYYTVHTRHSLCDACPSTIRGHIEGTVGSSRGSRGSRWQVARNQLWYSAPSEFDPCEFDTLTS
jgi:hypothetical protein